MLAPWRKNYDQPRQYIKKQRHHSANKAPYSQSYGFSISHVRFWELDHKKGWVPKNWCFWTVVLERTLGSPLDCKETKSVHPKGNKPWIFIGRTDAEAPIFWPPDVKSQLIGKDTDSGKDWRQEEKGKTKDEMVGWHHWLNRHEFEQAPGDGGHRNLGCCSPWGGKELDMTEWLKTTVHPMFTAAPFTTSKTCNLNAHQQMNWKPRWDIYVQWNITQPWRNEIMPYIAMWLDLEMSYKWGNHTEKDKYMIFLICTIL